MDRCMARSEHAWHALLHHDGISSDRCSPRVGQRELGHGDVVLAGADQVSRLRHNEVILLYEVDIFLGRDGHDGVAPHSGVREVACKAYVRV